MRRLLYAMLAVVLLSGRTTEAALIFDNLAAAGGPSAIVGAIGPGGTFGFGAELRFAEDTRISSFEVFNAIETADTLRFVIFPDVRNSAPLYVGDPIAFAADSGTTIADATWKNSGTVDFTFLAGRTYEVGAITQATALTPYLEGSHTVGSITSTGANPSFRFFTNPQYLGNSNVEIPIRLYGATAAVPEPSSALMLVTGITVAGLTVRSKLGR